MIPKFGPVELILILVIVTMLFGVGKLPEVFGSVGRGIREFRKQSSDPDELATGDDAETTETVETVETATPASAAPTAAATTASEPVEKQKAV